MLGQLFNTIFVLPILNLLVLLYKGFLFLGLPGAFGFAIIGLTIMVRLLLHPFFKQQIETAKKMQEMKPHLDRLSQKHKKDPKRLQQEQLKLYQQMGINPASGCLFMIVQMPIFIALYNTLSKFLLNGTGSKIIGEINKAVFFPFLKITSINPWFFGFNLALSPASAGLWYYYSIPVITAILQYLQANATAFNTPQIVPEKKDEDVKENKDKKEKSTDDFQKAMNTQMKFIFPLMIGWFSYSLPIGLSLYWNIFSIFSIIQYRNLKTQNSNLKTKV